MDNIKDRVQESLILIRLNFEGWKAEAVFQPYVFEPGIFGLVDLHLNYYTIAPKNYVNLHSGPNKAVFHVSDHFWVWENQHPTIKDSFFSKKSSIL